MAIEKNSNSSPVSLGLLLSGNSLPLSFLEGIEFGLNAVSLQLDILSSVLVKRRVTIILTLVTQAHTSGDI